MVQYLDISKAVEYVPIGRYGGTEYDVVYRNTTYSSPFITENVKMVITCDENTVSALGPTISEFCFKPGTYESFGALESVGIAKTLFYSIVEKCKNLTALVLPLCDFVNESDPESIGCTMSTNMGNFIKGPLDTHVPSPLSYYWRCEGHEKDYPDLATVFRRNTLDPLFDNNPELANFRAVPPTPISTRSPTTTTTTTTTIPPTTEMETTMFETTGLEMTTGLNVTEEDSNNTNAGAIAGGVIGGVIGAGLITVASYFGYKRLTTKSQEDTF